MSTIVTRAGKGSPLTHTEVDNNFTNLNTDKLQSGDTAASLAISSADINGGTIDGTSIGSSSAATGAFTSLSASGSFSANGGATLGDASGDALTINSSAVSIPNGLNFDSNTLVIDASNNRVGVGTASPTATLQVAGQVIGGGTSGAQFLGTNVSYIGSLAYFATQGDSVQRINVGHYDSSTVSFPTGQVAPQVLAGLNNLEMSSRDGGGGNIVFRTGTGVPERMRIDSSGNVGIGTSSPNVRLDVLGGDVRSALVGASGASFRGFSIASDTTEFASLKAESSSGESRLTAGFSSFGGFQTFYTNGSERMRIDTSGNVMIGTTSRTGVSKFEVSGSVGSVYVEENGARITFSRDAANYLRASGATGSIVFETGGTTQRMTLSHDGKLLFGRSTLRASEVVSFTGTPDSGGWNIECINGRSSGTANGLLIYYPNYTPNNTSNPFFQCVDGAGNPRLEVRSNGGIANYSANNVNLSDAREKTNVELAGSYLDKICAIPVKTFNYIDQNIAEDDGLTLGVIAQDVEAVAPELVMESNWGSQEEPKMRLSIYQTDLQYALMKCIQEQQAIITDLKARIETLENK